MHHERGNTVLWEMVIGPLQNTAWSMGHCLKKVSFEKRCIIRQLNSNDFDDFSSEAKLRGSFCGVKETLKRF